LRTPRQKLSGAGLRKSSRRTGEVFFVGDFLQPVHVLAVERFINGNVRHRGGPGRSCGHMAHKPAPAHLSSPLPFFQVRVWKGSKAISAYKSGVGGLRAIFRRPKLQAPARRDKEGSSAVVRTCRSCSLATEQTFRRFNNRTRGRANSLRVMAEAVRWDKRGARVDTISLHAHARSIGRALLLEICCRSWSAASQGWLNDRRSPLVGGTNVCRSLICVRHRHVTANAMGPLGILYPVCYVCI
jgi:hypothetical protein